MPTTRKVRFSSSISRVWLIDFHSDVLAELDLKPSGISGIQDDEEKKIDYPKISDDSIIFLNQELSPEQRMEVYYSFQLILRKGMNEWQVQLYPPNSMSPSPFHSRRLNGG